MLDLLYEKLMTLVNNVQNIKRLSASVDLIKKYDEIINRINLILENKTLFFENNTIRYQDFFINSETPEYNVKEFMNFSNNIHDVNFFIIYSITEYLEEINCMSSTDLWSVDEMDYLINSSDIYANLNEYLSFVIRYINYSESQKLLCLPFLENKYKIFFSGHSINDIPQLPKHVINQLIKKLSSPLSDNVVIPLAEGIDHVNEKYGTSFLRIQFANDYRIAFERVNDCTIILGVSLKNGKDTDYTRYDSIAYKNKQILAEANDFLSGNPNEKNQFILNFLQNIYLEYMKNKNPDNSSKYIFKEFDYFNREFDYTDNNGDESNEKR